MINDMNLKQNFLSIIKNKPSKTYKIIFLKMLINFFYKVLMIFLEKQNFILSLYLSFFNWMFSS